MIDYSIVFHPKAEDEFYEAFTWYEDRLEGLGHSFVNCVDAKLKKVVTNPLIFEKERRV